MSKVKRIPLGEVGTFQRGGNFKKSDFIEDGYPCIHYGQIHTKFGASTSSHLTCIPEVIASKCPKATKGDLVIAITSEDVAGSCKCTTWLGEYDIALGGHIARFRHNLNPKYIAYFFQSPYFHKAKSQYTRGFKVVEIKASDIAKIPIPIIQEDAQQRVVEQLDAEFSRIDTMQKNAVLALEKAKSLLSQVISNSLIPVKDWKEKTIGDLSKDIKYGTSKPSCVGGKFTYLRMNNITSDGHLTLKDTKTITLEGAEYEKAVVRRGDVIFNRTNSLEHVGKSCLFNEDEEMIIAGYLIRVRLKDEVIPEYLAYYLNCSATKAVLRKLAIGAVHQANISASSLKTVIVKYPADILEQQQIVARIKAVEDKVNMLKDNLDAITAKCDSLKQAILKETFE